MKTEDARWSRLRDLFSQAMDLPLEERQVFVDESCKDDPELRDELSALLSADLEKISGPLTSAVDVAIKATSRDRRMSLIGNVVGSYRLVSVLGHGGAGTVYLAERADRQYSAQVAVKIVESALLHADIGHRFRAERQILASLNHPHIARLLDAGETANGQPYLVMEYVHGEPIDSYCDKKQLSIEKRLELFLKVCEAVQYAHQNLIVHRDLKPANILVTRDGVPKLLDFGIAKLLDTNEAAAALALTRVNDRILTPEYASPEQILGQLVTTTSDVYALGVVLFELLTGLRPYQVSAASQLELERSICVTDPRSPSTIVTRAGSKSGTEKGPNIETLAAARGIAPKRFAKQLQGDLDAIVMRALRKEPTQRYSSVEQLVEDIRRHLNRLPVQARQGNWLYYTRRFARRHAFGVSVTVAAAVVLVAFSVQTSVQARRVAAERDRATNESQRAEIVSNFMLDVFTASDPFVNQGKETTARELLDRAGQHVASDLTQQPEVRARLLAAIGRAYQRQGLADLAVPYLQDAVRLERQFLDKNDGVLANTLMYLGIALREQGNFLDSGSALLEAQKLFVQDKMDLTDDYSQLLQNLARLEHIRGHMDAAQKYFEQALALTRNLHGNNHLEVAAILLDISALLRWKDDWPAAERAAREGVAIHRSTTPEQHPDRAKGDYGLAEILLHVGKLNEANSAAERALAVQRKLYGDASQSVAITLDMLSLIRQGQGKLIEAEQYSREALNALEKAQGRDNFYIGYFRTALAELLIKRGAYREAEQQARAALENLTASLPENHQYIASAEYVLAHVLLAAKRPKEAEPLLITNISRWQRSGASKWRAARSESALGVVLFNLNRKAEAEQHLQNSYKDLADESAVAPADAVQTAKERLQNYYRDTNQLEKLHKQFYEAGQ